MAFLSVLKVFFCLEFPCNFFERTTSLKKLNLSYNSIKLWSTGSFHFHKLEYLNLSHNSLQTLPSVFTQLKALKTLFLSYNDFSTFPPILFCLDLLQLNLDHNHITSLSLAKNNNNDEKQVKQIGQRLCNSLTSLSISDNLLTAETVEFVSRFTRLTFLNLARNHLTSFPDMLFVLTELRDLHLHENVIQVIPTDFVALSNLKSLTLYGNKLSEMKLQNTSALVHWKSAKLNVNNNVDGKFILSEMLFLQRTQ
jgi:Leucine-rich repeat (LRR) protein